MQPKRRRKLLIIVCAIFGVYLGINLISAWSFLHPPRHVATPIEGLVEYDFEGPTGDAPAFLSDNFHRTNLVFICVHGYLGNRNSFDDIATALMQLGYGVMIPSMPGQDASPIGAVGFGPIEAETVEKCIYYVRRQNPTAHIILLGVSLGGAACWMAAADEPRHIDAVVTEGAFANLEPAVTAALNEKMPLGGILLRPSVWIAELISGLRVSHVNPVEAAAQWKGAGLVIQAENDQLISRDQADQISQAAHVPEWIVPGADHAHCFRTDPKQYIQRLNAIAIKAIKG